MTAALTDLVEFTEITIPAPRRPFEVITGEVTPARRAGRVYAVLSAVAALLLILLAAPVLLPVAIAVKLGGGPVLFRQTPIGEDGREFTMLEFRSMCVDAETCLGAILRKYSIDELPQLFNVLGGTMALVGPRPALAREVAHYCPMAMRRLDAKPGLTGLWQVSGRSDLTWNESIRLDTHYVDTWTPALDIRILARTAGAVLRGGGAY